MTNNPEVSPATLECKNCGQPIIMDGRSWCHKDGYFGCNASRPRKEVTYAEPK